MTKPTIAAGQRDQLGRDERGIRMKLVVGLLVVVDANALQSANLGCHRGDERASIAANEG